MKDESRPLAPIFCEPSLFCEPSPRVGHAEWGGITHRQWLTGLAMQGFLANKESWNVPAAKIAEYAYQQADAVLAYEAKVNDT